MRLLIQNELRRRWRSVAALTLALGLGFGACLAVADAAHRTDTAYSRYLDREEVGDLVINPSVPTDEIAEVIETLPGVQRVTSDALMNTTFDDGEPRAVAEVFAEAGGARASDDGRYTEMDRPAVSEGRLPTGRGEAFLNLEAARVFADDRDLGLGDTLSVAFWDFKDTASVISGGDPQEVIEPIGVEELTIVGIGSLPDEPLADGLYPRESVIVSPDVARRYTCIGSVPPPGTPEEEVLDRLIPDGCAIQYRYWSLELEDGARGTDAAEEAFVARAAELTLPPTLENSGSYFLISGTTAEAQAQVDDTVQPTVAALTLFAAAAGIATVLAAATVVARMIRQDDHKQTTWRTIGLVTGQRALVTTAPALVAIAASAVLALLIALAASPLSPVGEIRRMEPDPGLHLEPGLLLPVLAALVGCLAVATGVLGWQSSRRAVAGRTDTGSRILPYLVRVGPPARGIGLETALRRGRDGGSRIVLLGVAAATAALVGAVTFGTNLDRLIDQPDRYGYPWELSAISGFGYGGTLTDVVDADLARIDGVEQWGHAAMTPDLVVDGTVVTALVDFGGFDQVQIVEGRAPAGQDEIALGQLTADELDVAVGDEVEVGGGDGLIVQGDVEDDGLAGTETRTATVVGTVVLPPIGPFQARRASPGDGALLSSDWLPDGALEAEDSAASFVGVDLSPGTDPEAVLEELGGVSHWSPEGDTLSYVGPVRPPQIVNATAMRNGPLLLAGVLASAMAVALATSLMLSVRARRHDLAILRVVGFRSRDLRATVRWQTFALLAVGLAIGVPVGTAVGRVGWRTFAEQLGVDPSTATPVVWLLATSVGIVVVGVLAAAVPARRAARAQPAEVLQTE